MARNENELPTPPAPRPDGSEPNPASADEVAQEFRRHTLASIIVLLDCMHNAYRHGDRIAAAREILDRGWGKAPAVVNVDPKKEWDVKLVLVQQEDTDDAQGGDDE